MYFPYIRAKQNDLAAICELNDKIYKSQRVVPIIEPVVSIKPNQYKKLVAKNIPFILIVNPIVGDLQSLTVNNLIISSLVNDIFKGYRNYWLGFIVQPNSTITHVKDFITKFPNHYHVFIHFSPFKDVDALVEVQKKNINIQYNIFLSSQVSSDYMRKFNLSNTYNVLVKDGFKKRPRNEHYPSEDFFYDIHKTYEADGFAGFGDFTVIGSQYETGGGPAYVVALHLTDLDEDENLIVRHFKSDTKPPLTSADPGGKFLYALNELKNYIDSYPILSTSGVNEYNSLHATGHFPGLGIPKKISIRHHIEIVYSML